MVNEIGNKLDNLNLKDEDEKIIIPYDISLISKNNPEKEVTITDNIEISVVFKKKVITEKEIPADNKGRDISCTTSITIDHKAYIEGYKDGTFRPNDVVARAEVVKIVNNALGRNVYKDLNITSKYKLVNKYSDVKDTSWYARDVYEASFYHTMSEIH